MPENTKLVISKRGNVKTWISIGRQATADCSHAEIACKLLTSHCAETWVISRTLAFTDPLHV